MQIVNDIFVWYLMGINILGTALMLLDKIKSRMGSWRISEKKLIATALLGGSVGIYLGVKFFRHKTRHIVFNTYVPIMIFVQLAFIMLLMRL